MTSHKFDLANMNNYLALTFSLPKTRDSTVASEYSTLLNICLFSALEFHYTFRFHLVSTIFFFPLWSLIVNAIFIAFPQLSIFHLGNSSQMQIHLHFHNCPYSTLEFHQLRRFELRFNNSSLSTLEFHHLLEFIAFPR